MAWTANDIPSQSGRTFVVTGANSGLGYISTLELARHGARVVMAVRTVAKGEDAAEKIRATVPKADLVVRRLDLADLGSIAEFAEATDALDVLVANAGIMMPPRELTKDGFESQIGSNHFGHFALAARLFPKLMGPDARIVTVTSGMHRYGKMHFDDLDGVSWYSPSTAYAQSKLANMLFGLELHRRLVAAGSKTKSVLAHPGYAATNLQTASSRGFSNFMMSLGNRVFAQSMEMGALDQLFAATSPSIQGGELIGPDGLRAMRGYPRVETPSRDGRNETDAKRLWQISEERTGVRFDVS
jgi:NAD(P)-dependent dehydrogenase (short-subunit alcohol dehydrogenase family)